MQLYCESVEFLLGTVYHHFLRAKAAAIPPATSPTAVAVMPIPITPSALPNKCLLCKRFYLYLDVTSRRSCAKSFLFLPLVTRPSTAFLRVKACLQSGAICKIESLEVKIMMKKIFICTSYKSKELKNFHEPPNIAAQSASF